MHTQYPANRNRLFLITVPLLFIFTLFVIIFSWVREWEYSDSLSDFSLLSEQVDGKVLYKLDEQLSLLEQMEGLFLSETHGHVTKAEFNTFVQKSLKRFPMIQALEWAPRVERDQRTGFESAQQKNLPTFEIREKNTAAQMMRAGIRNEYYPVTFIEPLSGNLPALGFDLASNEQRKLAITSAIRLGSAVITEPITLVQEQQKQSGVLLILGVDKNGQDMGVVLSVLRMGDFMDKLIQNRRNMIYTRLVDTDAGKVLYDNFDSAARPALYGRTFDFASRHYRLEFAPTDAYFAQHSHWQSSAIVVAGVLIVTLVGALLFFITGANVRISEQVMERTKQLKESEERWQFALEGAGEGVWDWNPQTDKVWFSRYWKEMIGFSDEEFPNIRAAFFERIHPDDIDRVRNEIGMHLQQDTENSIFISEYRMRCKDGTWKWILARGKLIGSATGRAHSRMIGIQKDITQRKQFELNLARESEKNKMLLRHASDGVHILDADGNLIEASDSFCAMLGYQRSEMIGLHVSIWDAQMSAEELAEAIKRQFATDSRSQFETRHRRKDGSIFDVEVSGCTIEMNGEIVLYNSSRDISDRKSAETQLQQAKLKAEEANRAKSDFLANMSHEIRTPMNGVIGLSELALDSADTTEIHDYLEQINESSKSLLGILNDILDFSKIEARQLAIENSIFSLDTLLGSLNQMFTLRAEEKGVKFSIRADDRINRLVYGDPLRLRQILTNLLGNAVKFTSQGQVTLDVGLQKMSETGMALAFTVQDTGIGMSPEQLENLFVPFAQADSSISRRFGGTGLGLSISLNLAKLMGGDIRVESVAGKGSTFRLLITLAVARSRRVEGERSATEKTDDHAIIRALKGKRVLLVEDTRINQMVATKMLDKLGMLVDIANNGKEALACLQQNTYDIVLMDVQMPVMNGLEATRLIRQESKFSALPIVAMSAGVMLDEQASCDKAGMTGFISKPIDSTQFARKLVEFGRFI